MKAVQDHQSGDGSILMTRMYFHHSGTLLKTNYKYNCNITSVAKIKMAYHSRSFERWRKVDAFDDLRFMSETYKRRSAFVVVKLQGNIQSTC